MLKHFAKRFRICGRFGGKRHANRRLTRETGAKCHIGITSVSRRYCVGAGIGGGAGLTGRTVVVGQKTGRNPMAWASNSQPRGDLPVSGP